MDIEENTISSPLLRDEGGRVVDGDEYIDNNPYYLPVEPIDRLLSSTPTEVHYTSLGAYSSGSGYLTREDLDRFIGGIDVETFIHPRYALGANEGPWMYPPIQGGFINRTESGSAATKPRRKSKRNIRNVTKYSIEFNLYI